jgi:hypothetical protein
VGVSGDSGRAIEPLVGLLACFGAPVEGGGLGPGGFGIAVLADSGTPRKKFSCRGPPKSGGFGGMLPSRKALRGAVVWDVYGMRGALSDGTNFG